MLNLNCYLELYWWWLCGYGSFFLASWTIKIPFKVHLFLYACYHFHYGFLQSSFTCFNPSIVWWNALKTYKFFRQNKVAIWLWYLQTNEKKTIKQLHSFGFELVMVMMLYLIPFCEFCYLKMIIVRVTLCILQLPSRVAWICFT